MYFVYILKSLKDNTYYKGQTNNLTKRLREHDSGRTRSIKNVRPFKLIHVEICDTRGEAIKLEKYFKSGFGREIIKEIDS